VGGGHVDAAETNKKNLFTWKPQQKKSNLRLVFPFWVLKNNNKKIHKIQKRYKIENTKNKIFF
jgi:hypothetical protein